MKSIEELIREGKSLDEIMKIAADAKKTVDKENEEKAAAEKAKKEKQMKIDKARRGLISNFENYLMLISGKKPDKKDIENFEKELLLLEKSCLKPEKKNTRVTEEEVDEVLDKIFKLYFY